MEKQKEIRSVVRQFVVWKLEHFLDEFDSNERRDELLNELFDNNINEGVDFSLQSSSPVLGIESNRINPLIDYVTDLLMSKFKEPVI